VVQVELPRKVNSEKGILRVGCSVRKAPQEEEKYRQGGRSKRLGGQGRKLKNKGNMGSVERKGIAPKVEKKRGGKPGQI